MYCVTLSISFCVLISLSSSVSSSFLFIPNLIHPQRSGSVRVRPLGAREGEFVTQNVENLKKELLNRVDMFLTTKALSGDFDVNFGVVRGTKVNATTRAPQKLDFYAISDSVGFAADSVISLCDTLASVNSISEPTLYLGNSKKGDLCPLDGPWKLIFTTAADATFSKNSTRGDAKVQNVVNAKKGIITNVIEFEPSSKSQKPFLKQLKVVIKATKLSEKRVGLRFQYAKAVFSRIFFLPIQWSIFIPVPGLLITRIMVFFNRLLFRRSKLQMPPMAFFDVVYLDKDLRIHKTGDDNIFVQVRESWAPARPLFDKRRHDFGYDVV